MKKAMSLQVALFLVGVGSLYFSSSCWVSDSLQRRTVHIPESVAATWRPLSNGNVSHCERDVNDIYILMNKQESALFHSYLKNSSSYFEWGSGGSTLWASNIVNGVVVSVEHHSSWCSEFIERDDVRCWRKTQKLHYSCVFCGHTIDYGLFPGNASSCPTYIEAIGEKAHRFAPSGFDMVLVDGRFRVAAALTAYSYLSSDGVLLVHDYMNRPHYRDIERAFARIESASTLTAFKKRVTISDAELKRMIAEYTANQA